MCDSIFRCTRKKDEGSKNEVKWVSGTNGERKEDRDVCNAIQYLPSIRASAIGMGELKNIFLEKRRKLTVELRHMCSHYDAQVSVLK